MTEKNKPGLTQENGQMEQTKDEALFGKVAAAGQKARATAGAMLEKGRITVAKAGRAIKAAAEAGWERVSDATSEGWDRSGQLFIKLRDTVARHPVSPLLYATILAVAIGAVSFQGIYTRAYTVNVDGVEIGVLENEEELDEIMDHVEVRLTSILGEDYDYSPDITLTPVYTTESGLTDTTEVEDVLFNGVGALVEAAAISVDGQELGYAPTKDELYRLLDELAQSYLTQDTIRYEFAENVEIYPVEVPANTEFDLEEVRAALTASEIEQAYYTVKQGDTFNSIAYSLDMSPNELSLLNPDIIVDQLWVDQQLLIQQAVPRLSVITLNDEIYEEAIESPVEYIETANLYVGETSIKEQGSDGKAQVNAKVTYLNGVEVEREVISTKLLQAATPTSIYTGTTPKPVTASNGYYLWPVRGTLTSYFGYRWGSFHLGIDIGVPYGTAISAADGGEVTYAGWQGSYGNLVVITHDNGNKTYYAHNSSLLVSVGQRVYQGQTIARAGSTGNSTGPHCHFEIRVNGTSVNPLNYL